MADDEADGFFPDGGFEDEAGVDIGGRDAASTDQFEVFESVGLIEEEYSEDLVGIVGEEGLDVLGGGFAVFELEFFGG